MTDFWYRARQRDGAIDRGEITAASREEALLNLRQQGLLVISLESKRVPLWQRIPSLNPLDYRSMHSADVEQGFLQLAVMLKSGVTLLEAVHVVAEFSRPPVRKIWLAVATRVREGESLEAAMEPHKPFGNLVKRLVRVGEQTGNLDRVLRQAASELERKRKIKAQLVQAMAYPSFVLLMAIGTAVFLVVKIIPEIKKLLSIFGRKMPPITQALIDGSNWIETHGPLIGIVTVVSLVLFLLVYQWPPARLWVDTVSLRLPVFGRVFRLAGTVTFSRTLELMLRAGVRIVDALETVQQVHYNRYLSLCVARARQRVSEGSSLADALATRYGYMPLLPRMIVVGENAGALDDILHEMTVFHEELLHKAINRLVGLTGPAITVLVGGLVGFVYAAFLVALFSAAGGSPK